MASCKSEGDLEDISFIANCESDDELHDVKESSKYSSVSDVSSDHLNYLPLAMTKDKKTEMYIKFAKVMVIFQGPWTDERSKTLEILKKKFNYASRILSDETFVRERKTPCDIGVSEEFYEYFESEAKTALEEGNNLLVINATMSHMQLNQHYINLALKMQYVILVVPPVVLGSVSDRWPSNSQADSFRKNGTFIHSSTMYKHLFCGWFLHDVDSHELRHEVALYIEDCIENIQEFQECFDKCITFEKVKDNCHLECNNSDEQSKDWEMSLMDRIKLYYRLEEKRQDLACCVTKTFSKMFEMNQYFNKNEVMKNYGKMSKLLIAGFIISPHMIAARVKLNKEQRDSLFEMEDEIDEAAKLSVPLPSDLLNKCKAQLPDVDVKLICSKSNQTLINSGKYVEEPLEIIHGRAKGKSCHFLLATTPEALCRNIDYDVAFALKRETKVRKTKEDLEPIDLERCVVKRIGKYWFIYLKELLVVDALFASSIQAYPYENAIGRVKTS